MWRAILTLLVVATLAGGVGVRSAHALTSDPPGMPATAEANKALVKALIRDIDAQGLANTANKTTGLTRMQVAAGLAPRFLGAVPLLGTAAVLEWKFAHSAWNPAGYIYKRLTGQEYAYTAAGGWYYSPGQWEWRWSTSDDVGEGANLWTLGWAYDQFGPTFSAYFCETGTTCAGTGMQALSDDAYAAPAPKTEFQFVGSHCNQGGSGECATFTRTNTQHMKTLAIQNSDESSFTAASAENKYTSPGTHTMPETTTDGELETALQAVSADDASARDAADNAILEAINDELDPDWDTITLPQPTINETYSAYIARLEALGWLGTATSTVLSSELEGYGPLAPARIVYNPGTGTRTLDPLRWPATAPTIGLETDITIRYNPETAAEAPGEDGTLPEAPATPIEPATPTTVPATPALDFTPITDLEGACSFPFGLVCYAIDVTEWFDVTPDAPCFCFTLDGFDTPLGTMSLGEYNVDLQVMDSHMATIRSLISVVLWIGGVYFLAASLLGFRAGGDPGEAADEALNV